MRIDGIAPRTWLLATVAAWALAAWTLSLLGMGERVQRLPDDSSLLWRLPQLAPASPDRLGPLAQYAETINRPLFSETRTPQAFSLAPEGDDNAAPAFDFVLTSVLLTPTLQEAIVQPSAGGESIRIKLGGAADSQPSWHLSALNPRSAIFDGPGEQKTLDLRVFDGNGCETPTAMQVAGGTNAGPPSKPTIKPGVAPAVPSATTTPAPAAEAADEPPSQEAQVDSIRKRIEERRAQLRQQAQSPATPPKNP